MKSAFRPSSFNEGNTYNERTDRFVGVDLTDPQIMVASKRGVHSKDYMRKQNGRVETRFGYVEIGMDKQKPILGMWNIKGHLIAMTLDIYERNNYAGANNHGYLKFHQASYNNGFITIGSEISGWSYSTWDNDYGGLLLATSKPKGFVSGDKLWVITGNDFVVVYMESGVWYASSVSSWSGTHVPTVTYMGIAANAKNIPSITNVTLEYPNLLSMYRKDAFLMGLGPNHADDGEYPKLVLQTKYYNASYPIEVTASRFGFVPGATTIEMTSLSPRGYQGATPPHQIVLIGKADADRILADPDHNELFYTTDQHGDDMYFHRYQDAGAPVDYPVNCYGYVNADNQSDVEVVLFEDYKPLVAGKPNVIVKYAFESPSQLASNVSEIKGCKIAVLFGANNSLNRLWLANGNKAIHSAEPYKGIGGGEIVAQEPDFSYFPDEGWITFGSNSSKIVAMQQITPDKMMVLKEKGNGSSMFFVIPSSYEQKVSESASIVREVYSTTISSTSTAGLCLGADCSLNGDVLFVSSEHQVVGLDIEGITGDSQRVANTRSHFVDSDLSDLDWSNQPSYGYFYPLLLAKDNYAFLFARGKGYVAYRDSYDPETGQYDWWPITLPRQDLHVYNFFDVYGDLIVTSGYCAYKLDFDQEDDAVCDIDRTFIDDGEVGDVGVSVPGYLVVSDSIASKLPDVNQATGCKKANENRNVVAELDANDIWVFHSDARTLKSLLKKRIAVYETSNSKYCRGKIELLSNGNFHIEVKGSAITDAYRPLIYEYEEENDAFFVPSWNSLVFRIGDITGDKTSASGIISVNDTGLFATRDPKCAAMLQSGRTAFFNISSSHEADESFPYPSLFGGTYQITIVEPSDSDRLAVGADAVFFKLRGRDFVYEHLHDQPISICSVVGWDRLSAFKDEDLGAGKVALFYRSGIGLLRLDICNRFGSASTQSITGRFEFEKPICPEFACLRLTQGKLGYDKTIENLTLWNDSLKPCELMVGVLTNKTNGGAKPSNVMDREHGFDLSALDFEATDFDQNNVPRFYNLKGFLRSQQSFTLCFTAKSKRISVLSGVDILYKVRKATRK